MNDVQTGSLALDTSLGLTFYILVNFYRQDHILHLSDYVNVVRYT